MEITSLNRWGFGDPTLAKLGKRRIGREEEVHLLLWEEAKVRVHPVLTPLPAR